MTKEKFNEVMQQIKPTPACRLRTDGSVDFFSGALPHELAEFERLAGEPVVFNKSLKEVKTSLDSFEPKNAKNLKEISDYVQLIKDYLLVIK